ncbi:MFS transporter [Bacillus pseudomycoides]|uniref:MFS transporter n=1 Tax=Bacillus pseudomycoides TaxID=64104 RepID=A0AA91VEN9_9BACI|nr:MULTISPECIES: MDR family MFS transporter [Bacillus]PEB51664.1 MFS transporter [Bacillus sp. AFS098217]PED83632.1 MFS transporter [Bacillus pseudomycoides]PEU12380.1 MFS transporter [Bacillus sp. AFS019443]PEU21740.1 MFS transporter [Bacillus sp. AFS014408]PFW62101.1 MFS transporter [Bacillus sp. AFS075034]
MRKKVMISLMLMTFLSAVEGTIVSTAIPRITSDLSGVELVSWVYAIYMLATAVSTPIYGKLADLFGRKKILLIGAGIFLIGSVLCGIVTSMEQLIVFRALQGIGAGAVMPITMTIIGDLYSEAKDRAKAQGWMSAVWGVSGVVGPLVGGFLVDSLSWRYIFFLNVPFGILACVMIATSYKESIKPAKHHIDYPGAIIFSLSTIALLYALLTGSSKQNWGDITIISLLIFAAVSFIIFLFVEKKSPEPLIPLTLFSNRTLSTINVLTLIAGAMTISITMYLPIWSQGVLGKNATEAGLILMPVPVMWTFGAMLSGNLVGKLQTKQIILLGASVLSIATFLLSILSTHSPAFLIYVAVGLLGFGMGLITPIYMITIQAAVPAHTRGTAVGLNTFINTFSQTLGAAVFGTIFNTMIHAQGIKNLDLVSSGGHGTSANIVTGSQEALATSIHVIYMSTFALALLTLLIVWFVLKPSQNKAEATEQ